MGTKSVGSNDGQVSEGKTVDVDEVKRHSKLADIWWNELGEMKGLHSMNKLRLLSPTLFNEIFICVTEFHVCH